MICMPFSPQNMNSYLELFRNSYPGIKASSEYSLIKRNYATTIGEFSICFLALFQSESLCLSILVKLSFLHAQMKLTFNEWMHTKPRWILFTVGNVDQDIGRYSGRHSVDSRSTLGRQSVDIAVDSRSIVGRHSVETQSIVVPDVSRPI